MKKLVKEIPKRFLTLAEAMQYIYYLECVVGGDYRCEKELDGRFWVYEM